MRAGSSPQGSLHRDRSSRGASPPDAAGRARESVPTRVDPLDRDETPPDTLRNANPHSDELIDGWQQASPEARPVAAGLWGLGRKLDGTVESL